MFHAMFFPAIGILVVAALGFLLHRLDDVSDWHMHGDQMRRRVDGAWEYREIEQEDIDRQTDMNAW